jgi:hypothetical protein
LRGRGPREHVGPPTPVRPDQLLTVGTCG